MMYSDNQQYRKWLQSHRWKVLRQTKLAADPWCEECLRYRRRTPATEVHHRNPVLSFLPSLQEQMMFSLPNLMSLCHDCHMKQHNRKEQKQHQKEREQNKMDAFRRKFGKT